tara:strand:- start:301 stop:507 length:207 start_codon:yes stop_codon:yes gene_type:complete
MVKRLPVLARDSIEIKGHVRQFGTVYFIGCVFAVERNNARLNNYFFVNRNTIVTHIDIGWYYYWLVEN